MKTRIISVLSLAFAFSSVPARAQDPGPIQGIHRDANGVDASVHASVDERPQAEPSQEARKRPTTPADSYSHWGFASHGELPNTPFWPAPPAAPPAVTTPARAKNAVRAPIAGGVSFRASGQTPASSAWPAHTSSTEMDPRSESNFEKVEPLPDPFQGLSSGWTAEDSEEPSRFTVVVPWLPWQPETTGLPGPFRQSAFGPAGGLSSLPSPFRHSTFSAGGNQAETNRLKNRPRKSQDEERAVGARGGRSEREKADRPGPSSNAE